MRAPNGRRRGVIRDVPPEDTPVSIIPERLRRESSNIFEQRNETEDATSSNLTIPTIIEVPQWLARLEPQIAALDSSEPVKLPMEQSEKKGEWGDRPERVKEQTRLNQRRLF